MRRLPLPSRPSKRLAIRSCLLRHRGGSWRAVGWERAFWIRIRCGNKLTLGARPGGRALTRGVRRTGICYDKSTPLIDTIPDILARIVAKKREDLPRVRACVDTWERMAAERRQTGRDFRGALAGRTPAIIAEVKKASPSKGL